MLFLGGDFDRLNQPVNDDVAIRWNRFLQRYEFTALTWDMANQTFAVEQEVVNASGIGPLAGFIGDVEFRLRVPDPATPTAASSPYRRTSMPTRSPAWPRTCRSR